MENGCVLEGTKRSFLCCMLWAQELPSYDTRRALLARDPLACSEGFRALVYLTLKHLFGMRFCPDCPNCATSSNPCTDAFGSNATAAGGIFGRIDAVYGAIECQKSGTLHAHFQVFLQCFHQHTPLVQLVRMGNGMVELLRKYTSYSAHVRRSIYCNPEKCEQEREEIEEAWPEYKDCWLMLTRPEYQMNPEVPEAAWKQQYLEDDVEQLQQRKQHHVHLPQGPKGERMPLAHCRDPNDPSRCKSGFPRDSWLTEEPVLVCPGVAARMGMPYKGKRSMLGLPWGPCNNANVNGNHPAMLAALRCNGDVQVPYRFPITEATHSGHACQEDCHTKTSLRALARDAQITQAAQTGYQCDYQNKRLPICRHEAKEWQKGHQHLAEDLKDKKPGYVGARMVKRLITDCYARGVCRGSVECTNLTTYSSSNDPTAAEAIKTAQTTELALQYPLLLFERAYNEEPWPAEPMRKQVDTRSHRRRQLIDCPFWTAYGSRGKHSWVHLLSPYEFARHFWFKMASHPWTDAACKAHDDDPDKYHAKITDTGFQKLCASRKPQLIPGLDYQIREEGGDDWTPLGHGELAQAYRHDWRVVVRPRPYVPVIYGALGSKDLDEQALKILVLFFPWVNAPEDASGGAPLLSDIRAPDMRDWRHALRARILQRGFPTEEVKRFALNFCFVYYLPRELQCMDGQVDNSDNEGWKDDVQITLDAEDLTKAMLTHVRGQKEGEDDVGLQDPEVDPKLYVLTKEMFHLSDAIWMKGKESASQAAAAKAHLARVLQAGQVQDHQAAQKAARASRSKSTAKNKKGKTTTGLMGQDPRLEEKPPLTAKLLKDWLQSDEVKNRTNAQQHELLTLVVERILVEHDLVPAAETGRSSVEPLVWLLHGPPGTGKSFVLHYLRKLFELIGYTQGISFEFTAFQAVNATDIGGKTLHDTFGINVKGDQPISQEKAKQMAYLRWLIVDEISLVNAKLLAQVEHRLRVVIPSANPWKTDDVGNIRPFAGINVLFTGDFNQLPPPEGGYLADIPARLKDPAGHTPPDALVDYGKELFWSGPVQGVVELTQRERCKDPWWNQVVDELRSGQLSENNWNYLHGRPVVGCILSEEERASRRRVITGAEDPRLLQEKFKEAVAIVSNNDARYQINKDRARQYSQQAGAPLKWAAAIDTATTPVLQVEACDKETKIKCRGGNEAVLGSN